MHQLQTRFEAVEQRSHPVARQFCWTRRLGGAMTRAAAGLLAVALVLTELPWAAPAGAQRPHAPLLTPIPVELVGYCEGFMVQTASKFCLHQCGVKPTRQGSVTPSM